MIEQTFLKRVATIAIETLPQHKREYISANVKMIGKNLENAFPFYTVRFSIGYGHRFSSIHDEWVLADLRRFLSRYAELGCHVPTDLSEIRTWNPDA